MHCNHEWHISQKAPYFLFASKLAFEYEFKGNKKLKSNIMHAVLAPAFFERVHPPSLLS